MNKVKLCKVCNDYHPLEMFNIRKKTLQPYKTCKVCLAKKRERDSKVRRNYKYPYKNHLDPKYIADKNKLFDGNNGWWWGDGWWNGKDQTIAQQTRKYKKR